MKGSHRTARRGFTLIEVLLVMALLVLLGTVVIVGYTRVRSDADRDAAKIMIDQATDQVLRYQMDMGRFPETEEGLQVLVTAPEDEAMAERWRGPYFDPPRIPVDPWNQELKYERLQDDDPTTPEFRIYSGGPDMTEDTEDDISSYTAGEGM